MNEMLTTFFQDEDEIALCISFENRKVDGSAKVTTKKTTSSSKQSIQDRIKTISKRLVGVDEDTRVAATPRAKPVVEKQRREAVAQKQPPPKPRPGPSRDDAASEASDVAPTNPNRILISELAAEGMGREDVVLGLIDSGGVNVNHANLEGLKPLYVAALNGRATCIPMLLRAGANINDKSKGETALHAAACARSFGLEVARILIDAGSDLAAKNAEGQSPGQLAAFLGKSGVAKLIGSELGKAMLAKSANSKAAKK